MLLDQVSLELRETGEDVGNDARFASGHQCYLKQRMTGAARRPALAYSSRAPKPEHKADEQPEPDTNERRGEGRPHCAPCCCRGRLASRVSRSRSHNGMVMHSLMMGTAVRQVCRLIRSILGPRLMCSRRSLRSGPRITLRNRPPPAIALEKADTTD